MRALLLALLVSTAVTAQTESVVLTATPDGTYSMMAASDEPVGDVSAALIRKTDSGAWQLRTLSPGDVPSEIAVRPLSNGLMSRLQEQTSRLREQAVRLRQDIGSSEMRFETRRSYSAPSSRVRYTVWFSRLPADAVPALLIDLEAEAPFTNADVQIGDETAEVELSFSFSSVEAWTEWTEQAGLDQRFAQDRNVLMRTNVEVIRPMRFSLGDALHGEIIDEEIIDLEGESMDVIGDGEIIDDLDFDGESIDVIGDGEIIDEID